MSWMSGTLILSYRLKEVTNSYVFHCFLISKNVHISTTTCPIEMGFESKQSILNGRKINVKNSKLKIADMWLIPLDRVTISDKTLQYGRTQCVPTTWHKLKTWGVTQNPSNHEYHLLENRACQKSMVHLRGSQAQFCYTRLHFILSESIFFFNYSIWRETVQFCILKTYKIMRNY